MIFFSTKTISKVPSLESISEELISNEEANTKDTNQADTSDTKSIKNMNPREPQAYDSQFELHSKQVYTNGFVRNDNVVSKNVIHCICKNNHYPLYIKETNTLPEASSDSHETNTETSLDSINQKDSETSTDIVEEPTREPQEYDSQFELSSNQVKNDDNVSCKLSNDIIEQFDVSPDTTKLYDYQNKLKDFEQFLKNIGMNDATKTSEQCNPIINAIQSVMKVIKEKTNSVIETTNDLPETNSALPEMAETSSETSSETGSESRTRMSEYTEFLKTNPKSDYEILCETTIKNYLQDVLGVSCNDISINDYNELLRRYKLQVYTCSIDSIVRSWAKSEYNKAKSRFTFYQSILDDLDISRVALD